MQVSAVEIIKINTEDRCLISPVPIALFLIYLTGPELLVSHL